MHPDWIQPPGLPTGVGAVFTSRRGGVSRPPYDELNLGDHVGDDPAAVAANRAVLQQALGVRPVFLRQVHGTRVLRLDAQAAGPPQEADACLTTERGLACCILVADCLPVLLAAPDGRGVAAAHAGWRGLAAQILEATVEALCQATGCQAGQLSAWLGPCIGPDEFEVGADVLQAFGCSPGTASLRFRPNPAGRWQADLQGLARDRLTRLGVPLWAAPATTREPRLYSYRREGATGRFAGCIWLR